MDSFDSMDSDIPDDISRWSESLCIHLIFLFAFYKIYVPLFKLKVKSNYKFLCYT